MPDHPPRAPQPPGPLPLAFLPPEHGWQPHPQVAAQVAYSDDNAFLLACTLTEDGEMAYHETSADLFAYFISEMKGGELLIHNADQTMMHLLPHFEQLAGQGYTTELTVNGQVQIIYTKTRPNKGRGTWRIRDTQAVLPMPLAQLGPIAGMTPEPPAGDMRDYLLASCRLVLAAYRGYCKIIRGVWQIGPARTAGATALKTWRRHIDPEAAHWRQRKEVTEMARLAYVGGMNWCADTKMHTDVMKVDVNAMYASVMRDAGVPTGLAAGSCYRDPLNRPAIYHCTCTCPPDNPFPFVPKRDDDGRVTYPKRGTFECVVPTITMEAAERHGYTFEVIWGFIWEHLEYPFGDWVDECERLETSAGTREGLKATVKSMRNALSGKFGQRPYGKQYYITDDPTDQMAPAVGLDGLEIDYLWYTEEEQHAAHMQPHWAAWITAAARNVLAEAVYAIGPEACIYGDTDAVVAPREAIEAANLPIGIKYGQWKIAGHYSAFKAMRSKMYLALDQAGAWETKQSGIPGGVLKPEHIPDLLNDKQVPLTFRSTGRALPNFGAKIAQGQTIAKRVGVPYNGDRWATDRPPPN